MTGRYPQVLLVVTVSITIPLHVPDNDAKDGPLKVLETNLEDGDRP